MTGDMESETIVSAPVPIWPTEGRTFEPDTAFRPSLRSRLYEVRTQVGPDRSASTALVCADKKRRKRISSAANERPHGDYPGTHQDEQLERRLIGLVPEPQSLPSSSLLHPW